MMNLDDQTRANLRFLRDRFALFLIRVILTIDVIILICHFL
jgi:hypothetical protein